MNKLDALLEPIFGGYESSLTADVRARAEASRRYQAFLETYQTKIRAKLRGVADAEGRLDLRAELEAAWLLLNEPRFTLEYEKHAAGKGRSPDFTVTYRTHTPFNVEVRRLRPPEANDRETTARPGKLMEVLADKTGQLPPGNCNVLWLAAEDGTTVEDVQQALAALRALAERKDDAAFARRGFRHATDYLRRANQLSAILIHGSDENSLWLNRTATHPLPPEIGRALTQRPPSS